ncbi:MAG: peptidylprolyl isomerase [Melioribacter sp.]|jgi:parvulin-like peptidyl-prolyl isomerase|uniref:peptidylprolyl isomerase n=1 Tax=Melioribacter sp. TaxID=2052167 RepID=UPI003BDA9D7D
MKKKLIKYLTLLAVLLIIFEQTAAQTKDSVLAIVGKETIYADDFVARYEEYLLASGIKDNIVTRKAILNNMINEITLYHYDDNKSIFNNPEYIKELEWARKQTVLAFLKDREVYAKITATEEELRDAFLKTNQKIAARHLFAFTKEEADSLYKLVLAGASFDSLAKAVFTDTLLANNGGYLGYFSWGDMDPAFEDAAYKMKIGEISAPVKTKYGYSIIKLEDRVTAPIITEWEFQKKKSHMMQVVRLRKKRDAELNYINSMIDFDKINMNQSAVNKLYNLILNPDNKESINGMKEDICAEYNGRNYTIGQLYNEINSIPGYHRMKITDAHSLETVIKGIILQGILLDEAVAKGYDKEPEVLSVVEKYHKNIFLKYKREEIHNAYKFPDSAVYRFYLDNPQHFKNEPLLKIQEIVVESKALADSIRKKLDNNGDFSELAKAYSTRKSTAAKGGIIDFTGASNLGMIKDLLLNSEPGDLLGPLRIGGGYAIVKLLGKKEGGLMPYESVRKIAERLLKKEKSKIIMEEYINGQKKDVFVKINEKLLSEIEIEI